jgi:transcriptional regulator with XRE-family HTH domain
VSSGPTNHADGAQEVASTLTIRVGADSYRVERAQSPVVIGRPGTGAAEKPHIPISDGRVSREHLVVHARDGSWYGVPKGRNGVFINGEEINDEFEIPEDELTVVLGHPNVGVQVHFSGLDPSLVYVGTQVAQRRNELEISQRTLAAAQVMNAGALITFEKGRSWPRQKTREKLEEALGWPAGHIENLRRQYKAESGPGGNDVQPTDANDEERTVLLKTGGTTAVESRFMAETIAVALSNIKSQIAALPAAADPSFQSRVGGLIADLNRLESAASNASRGSAGAPDILLGLGEVRRVRRELMLQAARSPNATIGQRVFAARHRAELTLEEAAAIVGISAHDLSAAEAGQTVSPPQLGALQRLVEVLR